MGEFIDKDSRIGKLPVALPAGVQITTGNGTFTAKGKKGEITRQLSDLVEIKVEGSTIHIQKKKGTGKDGARFQGLVRALVKNAVKGVSDGYKLSLDLVGTGYRADLKGQTLDLALGLSHHVIFELPKDVKASVETIEEGGAKRPRLHLESIDNQILGQAAARIRSFRPPEPYKGKGVRFMNERIRQKAGKAAAGGAKGGK
ncbi:MAG: 50S ribosomal protein L6 [Polyangiales bacterium]|nr:50S ribosomal protein L6 [Myxococcales bacterium]